MEPSLGRNRAGNLKMYTRMETWMSEKMQGTSCSGLSGAQWKQRGRLSRVSAHAYVQGAPGIACLCLAPLLVCSPVCPDSFREAALMQQVFQFVAGLSLEQSTLLRFVSYISLVNVCICPLSVESTNQQEGTISSFSQRAQSGQSRPRWGFEPSHITSSEVCGVISTSVSCVPA